MISSVYLEEQAPCHRPGWGEFKGMIRREPRQTVLRSIYLHQGEGRMSSSYSRPRRRGEARRSVWPPAHHGAITQRCLEEPPSTEVQRAPSHQNMTLSHWEKTSNSRIFGSASLSLGLRAHPQSSLRPRHSECRPCVRHEPFPGAHWRQTKFPARI